MRGGGEREGKLKIDFHLAAFRYFDALLACFTFGSCFRFVFFWFFVIRCMQMRSLICFGIDSLLKTSSECHTKHETESHLTRRGRACQSTEMLIS